ncbi:hypothetical protein FGO68_gene11304 [Halteria grandinella]|uniref:Uncharacterized protein n=1 Tax=Halteria grandinella TaxID=5974 RepID=A0A8J8NEI4_HALGN|nr:hypothetical protein FGO68_gene11304 [Halteria grandinella]
MNRILKMMTDSATSPPINTDFTELPQQQQQSAVLESQQIHSQQSNRFPVRKLVSQKLGRLSSTGHVSPRDCFPEETSRFNVTKRHAVQPDSQEFEALMRNRLRQLNKAINSVKSETLRKNEFRAAAMLNHHSSAHASPAVQPLIQNTTNNIMDDLINPIVSVKQDTQVEPLDKDTVNLITQQHLLAVSNLKQTSFIITKKKRVTPFSMANNQMFQSAPDNKVINSPQSSEEEDYESSPLRMSSSPLANFGKVSVRQCHKPNIKIPRSALCKIDTPYLRLASPKSPQRENTHPSQLDCDKVYESYQKHQEKVGTPEISGQLSSKRNRIDRTEKKGMVHNESFTQLSDSNRHVRKAIVLQKRNLHSGIEQKKGQSQEFALAGASFGKQFPNQKSVTRLN